MPDKSERRSSSSTPKAIRVRCIIASPFQKISCRGGSILPSSRKSPRSTDLLIERKVDFIRNKEYNGGMLTYTELQSDHRKFLSLTGLTLAEFRRLLTAFARSYERRYPPDLTVAGRPRQRSAGGGRKGALHRPEQKLLFILVYLRTYPLQVVMGELFGLSQPAVNSWIHRLLPVLRACPR